MRTTTLRQRITAAAFVSVLMVPLTDSMAHSHWPGVLVGKIGKIQCKNGWCSATVAVERLMGSPSQGDQRDNGSKLKMANAGFPAPASPLAEKDRVWFGGEVDILESGPYMHADVVIRAEPAPQSSPALGYVFPGCGAAPWNQKQLETCYRPDARSRAVTVTGTLLGPPFQTRAGLLIEITSVKAGRVELAPPSNPAFVSVHVAKYLGATVHRPKVATLRAGDVVTLAAVYVLPAPEKSPDAVPCFVPQCLPVFNASTITLVKAASSSK